MSSFYVFVIFATALAKNGHCSVVGGDGHRQTFGFILHESIHLRHGTVESHDVELLMIGNIEK